MACSRACPDMRAQPVAQHRAFGQAARVDAWCLLATMFRYNDRYFKCKPLHGVLCKTSLVRLSEARTPPVSSDDAGDADDTDANSAPSPVRAHLTQSAGSAARAAGTEQQGWLGVKHAGASAARNMGGISTKPISLDDYKAAATAKRCREINDRALEASWQRAPPAEAVANSERAPDVHGGHTGGGGAHSPATADALSALDDASTFQLMEDQRKYNNMFDSKRPASGTEEQGRRAAPLSVNDGAPPLKSALKRPRRDSELSEPGTDILVDLANEIDEAGGRSGGKPHAKANQAKGVAGAALTTEGGTATLKRKALPRPAAATEPSKANGAGRRLSGFMSPRNLKGSIGNLVDSGNAVVVVAKAPVLPSRASASAAKVAAAKTAAAAAKAKATAQAKTVEAKRRASSASAANFSIGKLLQPEDSKARVQSEMWHPIPSSHTHNGAAGRRRSEASDHGQASGPKDPRRRRRTPSADAFASDRHSVSGAGPADDLLVGRWIKITNQKNDTRIAIVLSYDHTKKTHNIRHFKSVSGAIHKVNLRHQKW